ncbi:MAG: DUF2279 domain-containing protein [Ferruginibacter sp.]|nr:DUF2279 domain-containing protein [Ferruginibacter sp.]
MINTNRNILHSFLLLLLLSAVLFVSPPNVYAQYTFRDTIVDQSLKYPYNKRNTTRIAIGHGVIIGGSLTALSTAWYKNHKQTSFHFFNDMPEWMQMDKIGHIYSTYTAGHISRELWRTTGIDRKKQIWYGGLSGVAFQTVIETLDGFSSEWGWSWGDFGANILGAGMFISQELAWDEQRIQMKFSFNHKRYGDPELNVRSDQIFGRSAIERFLKDYNGQTYWLSTDIKYILPHANLPDWLQVSIGTGIEGVFGGRENFAEKDGLVIFNRPDIKRYRQWYLAPDIDLTKIKTQKRFIRTLLNMVNVIKFPTPALALSNGKLQWKWIAF